MRQSLFVIAALAALLLIGCSPVAWAPRETPHTSSIGMGQEVSLHLRDGSTVTGTYVAVQDLSQEEYDRYYAARVHDYADAAPLPRIGQNVLYTTSLDGSRVWQGTLLGFDESSLLLMGATDKSNPEKIYFSSLGTLTSRDGKPIRRMILRGMFLNGEIPLKSALVIQSALERRQIPLSEIEKITALPADESMRVTAWLNGRAVTWGRN